MKNLLFIEGNRTRINNANVVEAYNKIKALGFIETMPIEFFPMSEVKTKLGNRKLFKPTVTRKRGKGIPIISNFEIEMKEVQEDEYDQYDGVCGDGQHRDIALAFDELKNTQATYQEVKLPKDMDILGYISIRNNGKKWTNDDFYASNITIGDENADYILSKMKDGYTAAFLFNVYTLGSSNLTPAQIKSIQQGHKKLSDFSKVQINADTRSKGDQILDAIASNNFMTIDRCSGRLGSGIKQFYNECDKDINLVIETIMFLNKACWNRYFTSINGQSMEARAYKEAFLSVKELLSQKAILIEIQPKEQSNDQMDSDSKSDSQEDDIIEVVGDISEIYNQKLIDVY